MMKKEGNVLSFYIGMTVICQRDGYNLTVGKVYVVDGYRKEHSMALVTNDIGIKSWHLTWHFQAFLRTRRRKLEKITKRQAS